VSQRASDEIARRLREFILEELIVGAYNGTDPLAEDAVDSLGQEQLAEFVEETYDIRLEDDDMVNENFESVPALAALVHAKLEAGT
jgi:acyl carrier protein